MSRARTLRPLRPLAAGWAAFGILPYFIGALLVGRLGATTWAIVGLELAALLLVALVVRRRTPVPWRRLATAATFATFAFACLRFGVLPFVDPRRFGSAGGTATLDALGRIFQLEALVDAGFAVACLLLVATCGHALWRARATSDPGSAS